MLLNRSRVWLPGVLHSARSKPGDHVSYFLVRHRLAGRIAAPIGRTQFRPASDNNRAQSLITNQRKERIVRDGASLGSALAGCPVAGCAILTVSGFALLYVAGDLCGVRR